MEERHANQGRKREEKESLVSFFPLSNFRVRRAYEKARGGLAQESFLRSQILQQIN